MPGNGIKIKEIKKPEKGASVIFAFPDVGLVGPIAVKHLVDKLGMEEIGYITSDGFPPVTAIHNSRPSFPIRIFERDNLVVVTSEVPIPPNLINSFSNTLADWLEEIEAGRALILGGLARQDRSEIDVPEVHGIPTGEEMKKSLEENSIHVLEEGFISGINGVFVRELFTRNFPGIYLMAEAYRNYPDPGSAAAVLRVLNDLEDIEVGVDELLEKEEEIKVAARDLMRKTQKAMQKSGKDHEEEMPMMYG